MIDNVGYAMLSLFQVMFIDGFSDIMYNVTGFSGTHPPISANRKPPF